APAYGAPVLAAAPGYAPWATPQVPAEGPAKTFVFKGKTYQAIDTNERGESEEMELRVPTDASLRIRRPSDGEHFAGVARAEAKTMFVSGTPQAFDSPGAVLDFILQGEDRFANDSKMRAKLHPSSPRAP